MNSRYLGRYNDVLLFIILIPIINTINYHLTYSRIRWDWYTYTTYLIDTAQGYIAWWIIRKIILWFDQVLPYQDGFSKRILLQILLTNIAAQGFIILATEGINALFTDQPLPSNFYTINLFIFFIWILVINGIYISMYFHHEWAATQVLRQKDRQLRASGLEVQLGNSIRMVPFHEIAYIFVDEGVTTLRDASGKTYILDRSLNKLTPGLPQEIFFRLNRKYIAQRNFITGYRKDVNGKLVVNLQPGIQPKEDIIVSRISAPSFKTWYRVPVRQS
jgi:DNA-binding LytR/AlgR family response regulator